MDEVTPEGAQPHPVFELLRVGVPLSLLCDLAQPFDSGEVLRSEPADAQWLVARTG
jgi:hypothetical protein